MDDYIGLFIAAVLFPLAVASVIGAICYALVTVVTRNVVKGRRLVRGMSFLFPLVAIFYLAAGIIIRDFVRESRGSDGYFDSSYHYPLVNGFQFAISGDYPDGGTINGPIGFSELAESVQVAGNWILADQGKADSSHAPFSNGSFIYHGPDNNPTVELGREGERLEEKFKRDLSQNPPKQYLIIDTTTSKVTRVHFEELKLAAAEDGVALNLVTTEQALHSAASAASPSRGFLGMLLAPVLLVFIFLLYKLRQLVRTA